MSLPSLQLAFFAPTNGWLEEKLLSCWGPAFSFRGELLVSGEYVFSIGLEKSGQSIQGGFSPTHLKNMQPSKLDLP